jgi:hypothetical protein
MEDKRKRFASDLLDASLRHYAKAEPRPGLEGRVMASVRARQLAVRRRTVWAWSLGIAAAVTAIAMFVIYSPRRQQASLPVTANAPAMHAAPHIARTSPVEPSRPAQRLPHPPSQNSVDTRPQQFPTPRPLSKQEKLLLLYVQSVQSSAENPAPDGDQIPVRNLEIPPISMTAIKIEALPSLEDGNAEQEDKVRPHQLGSQPPSP